MARLVGQTAQVLRVTAKSGSGHRACCCREETRMNRVAFNVVGLFMMVNCLSCNDPSPPRSEPAARETIENVFQTKLPLSAENCHVSSTSLMTLEVCGTFDCSADDLDRFLTACELLPDALESGTNPLSEIKVSGDPIWWRPVSLKAVSGAQCEWDAGRDVASCRLVAGRAKDGQILTVYFMVVYEAKTQTSLQPERKAASNWRKKSVREPGASGP